ncbi:MAG: ARL2BP/CFAP36 family protein [archaeon]|nr:ARL2BP/CFAP36 family protein [archaeon]
MQNEFLDKYYNEFEEKEENKLIYTDIFKKYTQMTESYIEQNLIKRVPQYKIDDFYKLLEKRKKQIDDQLMDTLISFTDFQAFKEMILDYKARKNQRKDLFNGISISKMAENKKEDFDNFETLQASYKANKGKKKK